MKAIIFARVSTKEQEDGHSLEAQMNKALEYAIDNNLQIIKQFRIIESSTKGKRPEFKQMIDFIKKSKEKIVVLAYNTDRLQRDFDEQSLQLKRLVNQDRAEIHFVSTKQKITAEADSSTKFRYSLDVLLANDYANRISDNVKRSNQKKLEEGTILSDSPLGYLNKKRLDKKLEKTEVSIDPQRGHLVKKMFELYATGNHSIREVKDIIAKEGLRSKKDNLVSTSQAEAILKNPFYYGYMKYNGLLYKHIHPRLISKELFDTCQDIRSGRRKIKYKRTEKPFILKGLLKCQHCQCSYSPEIKKGKYVYMRPTKSKGQCNYCTHLSEKKILNQVEAILEEMVIPKNILKGIHHELKKSHQKEHQYQMQEIKKLTSQIEQTQKRIKRTRMLFIDNALEKEEFHEIMTDLEVENQNLTTRLQHLQKDDQDFNKNIVTIFEIASKSYEIFKSSELDEKRRIINMLFPNLEMNAQKLVYTLRKEFDMFLKKQEHPKKLPE